jgi:hypothetical protein
MKNGVKQHMEREICIASCCNSEQISKTERSMNKHWLRNNVRHLYNSNTGGKKFFSVATDNTVEHSKVLTSVMMD